MTTFLLINTLETRVLKTQRFQYGVILKQTTGEERYEGVYEWKALGTERRDKVCRKQSKRRAVVTEAST